MQIFGILGMLFSAALLALVSLIMAQGLAVMRPDDYALIAYSFGAIAIVLCRLASHRAGQTSRKLQAIVISSTILYVLSFYARSSDEYVIRSTARQIHLPMGVLVSVAVFALSG